MWEVVSFNKHTCRHWRCCNGSNRQATRIKSWVEEIMVQSENTLEEGEGEGVERKGI